MMEISRAIGYFFGGALIGGIIPWLVAKRKGRSGIGCAGFLACGLVGFINPLLSVAVGIVFLIGAVKAEDYTKEEAALNCHYSDIEGQLSQSVKDFCREHAGDRARLEAYLNECKNQRLIKGGHVGVILKEFTSGGEAETPKLSYKSIENLVPQSVKDRCREFGADRERMERYLRECANARLIKAEHVAVIADTFAGAAANPQDGKTVVDFENMSRKDRQDTDRKPGDYPQTEPVDPGQKKADAVDVLLTCPSCGRRQSAGHTHCAVCQADLRKAAGDPNKEASAAAEQPEKPRDPVKSEAQKTALTKEQLQQLQAAVNDNYPGMMMFVRDVDLPFALTARYKPGSIIRERAYVDASARIGGVGTSHRYVILSNHMVNYGYFAKDADWQHYAAGRDSRFKVLGTHMHQGKTAIVLLHLPDSEAWKLFRNVEVDVDEQILADSIRHFEECCAQPPVPALMDEEWLSRCAFPLGMDERGNLWELD